MEKKTINISNSTIFRTLIFVISALIIFQILDILVVLFIAFIIISAISPIVDKFEKVKIPRVWGTVMVYAIFFLIIGFPLSQFILLVLNQFTQLINKIPEYLSLIERNSFLKTLFNPNVLNEIDFSRLVTTQTASFGLLLKDEFKRFIYIAVVFSLSFYMTIQKNSVSKLVMILTPKKHEKYAVSLVARIQDKLGRWLQGQITLNIIIGVTVYLILTLLGVPYAIILAVIAGLLEFIPNLGATISTTIAFLIALTISPVKALIVLIAFIIMQQMENHILVPVVMRKAVGLSPVVVIIALLIGIKFGGPIGAIIAVPLVTALSEFVSDIIKKPEDSKISFPFNLNINTDLISVFRNRNKTKNNKKLDPKNKKD